MRFQPKKNEVYRLQLKSYASISGHPTHILFFYIFQTPVLIFHLIIIINLVPTIFGTDYNRMSYTPRVYC